LLHKEDITGYGGEIKKKKKKNFKSLGEKKKDKLKVGLAKRDMRANESWVVDDKGTEGGGGGEGALGG